MSLIVKSLILLALVAACIWGWTQHRARLHEANAEAAYPPEGQFVNVDGHRVHGVVMGPAAGEAPDLVLIHGASGSTRDMTFSLAPRLAEDYRVIVLDRPGLGYTDQINGTGATIIQQADLLQRAAARFGADRPIVLGHSYGGAVALAWAVTRPDHVSALVAVSGAAKPWEGGISTYYKVLSNPVLGPAVIPFITAYIDDSQVDTAVAGIFTPQAPPEGYLDHVGAGLSLRRHSLRENALQRANLLAEIEALHTRYGEISVPVEILHGTEDTIVGLAIHSIPLADQVAGSRLTPLDGIGHMPHHAAEDAVVEAIHRAATRAGLRDPG